MESRSEAAVKFDDVLMVVVLTCLWGVDQEGRVRCLVVRILQQLFRNYA